MLGRADVLEDRLLLASVERHEGHVQHLEDARKGSGNGLVADVVLVVVGPGEVVQIRANKQFASVSDLFPENKIPRKPLEVLPKLVPQSINLSTCVRLIKMQVRKGGIHTLT